MTEHGFAKGTSSMQIVFQRASVNRKVHDTALHGFADRFISRFAHDRVNIQTLPFSSPQIAMIGAIRSYIEKPL